MFKIVRNISIKVRPTPNPNFKKFQADLIFNN